MSRRFSKLGHRKLCIFTYLMKSVLIKNLEFCIPLVKQSEAKIDKAQIRRGIFR